MTTTRPANRLMTAEEFLNFEGKDGYRYDLVDGKLDRMAAADRRHGRITVRFGRMVDAFVEERGLGEVYAAETGFILARNPDVVLAPDVSYVRAECITVDLDEDGFLALAPDLAVEVISQSQRTGKIREKAQRYLDAGVPLLVLIYPRWRRVTVYRGRDRVEKLDETGVFDGGDVLPGFRLPLADIFGA
jgi:Uma2 family endonuclease